MPTIPRPTEFAYMAARAYIRVSASDSPDYHQARSSRIYDRFGRSIEAVAQYEFEARAEERARELSEWIRSQHSGGSRGEPSPSSNSETPNR